MSTPLEPITPGEAIELYLKDKQAEFATSTVRSHRSRLRHFQRWCAITDVTNLNDLTGRKLHEFRMWRREDGDLKPVSEKTQMDTLRVFVRWCESIDAVPTDMATKVVSPSLEAGENIRDEFVDAEVAESILDYLAKYEYASARHVIFLLMWRGALRRGSIVALDTSDYDADGSSLEIRHRPKTGTPLKNQYQGERFIALSESTMEVLDAWMADRRPEVCDEHDREPLVATAKGRPHPSTIQKYVYSLTRPCVLSNECPHGRDIEACEAARTGSQASTCPSSSSPHTVRRGALTHWLQSDLPESFAVDRANLTPEVLRKHYDRRSQRKKMEQRRKYLKQV